MLYGAFAPFQKTRKNDNILFKIPYLYETGNEWDNRKLVLVYAGRITDRREQYMQESRQQRDR